MVCYLPCLSRPIVRTVLAVEIEYMESNISYRSRNGVGRQKSDNLIRTNEEIMSLQSIDSTQEMGTYANPASANLAKMEVTLSGNEV